MSNERLNNKTMVEVSNKRKTPYTAYIKHSGEYYAWLGATSGIEDMIEMNFRDLQWLHTNSSTFTKGYLYIENEEVRKRLGLESEEVKRLTMSREEIEANLKGNMSAIKKFDAIKDNKEMVREVIAVAREIKVNNASKLAYLSEISGIPQESLMPQEEE